MVSQGMHPIRSKICILFLAIALAANPESAAAAPGESGIANSIWRCLRNAWEDLAGRGAPRDLNPAAEFGTEEISPIDAAVEEPSGGPALSAAYSAVPGLPVPGNPDGELVGRIADRHVTGDGLQFATEGKAYTSPDGGRSYHFTTRITDGGERYRGKVVRSIDWGADGKATIVFESAFVRKGLVTLDGGSTLTVADYATLRQLKAAGVAPGNVRELVGSVISNQRTILELLLELPPEILRSGSSVSTAEAEKAVGELILKTHTSRYAGRVLELTGNRIQSARVKIHQWPSWSGTTLLQMKVMLDDSPETAALYARAKARLCPTTDCSEILVPKGFSIHYDVVPK